MSNLSNKEKTKYYNFLNNLAKKLTKIYFSKFQGTFKIHNKLKNKGKYDPVTNIDKAFEKFIRTQINKKFPTHNIIGEEYKDKKNNSDFSWVIDPIDGTRSFVIGNPTWSNLISLNFRGKPMLGLANFPMLKKYYISGINKSSYVVEGNKKKKLKLTKIYLLKMQKLQAIFIDMCHWIIKKKYQEY